jgi:HK97 family phage portal protein
VPDPNDVDKFADDGYRKHSIVKACITEKATSAAEPRLVVEQIKDGEWVELSDPGTRKMVGPGMRMLRMFERPNPEQSQYEFLELLITHMEVAGNAFVHKERAASGKPVELWLLRPDRIKPVPAEDGTVAHWVYGPAGREKKLPTEDVVQLKYPDPLDDYWGLSPILSIALAGDLDTKSLQYLWAYFENGGVPSGLLTLMAKVPKSERERIRDTWRGQQTGKKAHDLAVLDADAKFQAISANPDRLKLDSIFDVTESRVCSAFGVPPIIVGVRLGLIRSTFANYREARRSFWRETLAPLYARVQDKLTFGVASEYGTGIRVWMARSTRRAPMRSTCQWGAVRSWARRTSLTREKSRQHSRQ